MTVVSNPLPIKAPRESPRDIPDTSRVWDAVRDCVSFIRALLGGRIFEWHEDVPVDGVGAPIKHGLRRRPWGVFIVRDADGILITTPRDLWTETEIVLKSTSRSSIVAFILF